MNKNYIWCVVCLFLFLFVTTVFVTQMDDVAYKLDNYFNPKQEIVDERFIVEYQETGIGIYHDNELNVTCWSTGAGLSCISDIHLNRSDGKVKKIETKHIKEVV